VPRPTKGAARRLFTSRVTVFMMADMMHLRHGIARGLGALMLLVLTQPLWAQAAGQAPQVNPWPAILITTLLAAVVIGASFKGSKRGHQD